ncbi:unnamed protein product [Rangifer tarandus platyrhynchus]|uniref:Uncharacterized protein n=1 Tax=Rangifer tarandus platyrhynchus TaxID=3082113 RepID=A0ABN8YW00_RANTA|nr:unnamed protein product [Rangifer tarandus platyrhynchus]
MTRTPEAAELPFPELQSSRPDSRHGGYQCPRLIPRPCGPSVCRELPSARGVQRAEPEPQELPSQLEGGRREKN